MSQRIRRKDLKTDEIAEAAFDFGHWIEENWKLLARWGGVVVVVAIVVAAFFWMNARKESQAVRMLGEAQALFSETQGGDSVTDADRSAALAAFEEVIDYAGSSNPGRSALYYKAAILNQLGRSDEAAACLEELIGSDTTPTTLRGQAELLLASLIARSGRPDEAVERLNAAIADENSALAPEQALLEIGRIHREQGDVDLAHEAWQRVIDEYGQSPAASEARQLLGPDVAG